MKRENDTFQQYIKIAFYLFVTISLVAFIGIQLFYPSERESSARPDNLRFEGTLYWEKPDGTTEEIVCPGNYPVEPGETMVISATLPEDYKETSLCIRGSQQDVRFYIDGELRSEYDTKNTRPFGSNSASRYVFCATSERDAGKKLRIELHTDTKRYSGVVNQIYCGDKADIWMCFFDWYGLEGAISLFLLYAGLVTVFFSLALCVAYKTRINMVYLGWCMVLGAIWMLGESKLRQVFVSNTSALAALCFVVVMLCPVPVLLYVDSVQEGRYRRLFNVIECVAILNLVTCSILQLAEIADYLDMLYISHIILIVTFAIVLITFLIDWRKDRVKKYRLIVIGLGLAMIGAIVESVSAYFVVHVSGLFLGSGLLILLSFTIVATIKDIRNLENRRQAEQLEKRRKQTEATSLQFIQTLSVAIEAKDEYTKGHSYRVAEYSALIARKLGWSDEEIENLKNAACLHDIGKIGIPDSILNKPTKLLDEEYEIIRKHTTIGADILKNISLIQHAEEVARYHHERYDGRGYPEGLCGENIPVYARIIAVADSYDAMNSRRIYRDKLSPSEIRSEMNRNKGIQFDPQIADAFLELFDENRLHLEETNGNYVVNGISMEALAKPEVDGTSDALQFITDVVDTLQSQKNSQNIDFLTGLAVRNEGEKQIAQKMQTNSGCLVFIDLDNLKKINDIYGHRAGDKVLQILGKTITECAKDAIACRLGGDEFLFFLPDASKEAALEQVEQIFEKFREQKEKDVEIHEASLSGGLCVCIKGDSFTECYAKADKALYYVKQNGKDSYSVFQQIEKSESDSHRVDLVNVAKALSESGNYVGPYDLGNREFSKMFEYVSKLSKRYQHSCHLVMITLDAVSDSTTYIDKIEQVLDCMETAIRGNIRNVDICTRYSSMQYLVILIEAREEMIPLIMERIFSQYYKIYNGNDFRPHYESMPMLGGEE